MPGTGNTDYAYKLLYGSRGGGKTWGQFVPDAEAILREPGRVAEFLSPLVVRSRCRHRAGPHLGGQCLFNAEHTGNCLVVSDRPIQLDPLDVPGGQVWPKLVWGVTWNRGKVKRLTSTWIATIYDGRFRLVPLSAPPQLTFRRATSWASAGITLH